MENTIKEVYLKVRLTDDELKDIKARAIEQGYVTRTKGEANVSRYVRDALRFKAIMEDKGLTYSGAIEGENVLIS